MMQLKDKGLAGAAQIHAEYAPEGKAQAALRTSQSPSNDKQPFGSVCDVPQCWLSHDP